MVEESIEKLQEKFLYPNPNLTNFYFYRSGFTKEKIQRIIEMIPPDKMCDGNVSGIIDKSYRSSRICWIQKTPENTWLYEELLSYVMDANKQMWNFDLSCLKENIQFTEYDANYQGHYDWHMDLGGLASSTRKLSVSVQLSDEDEYEGGDLQLMIHRTVIPVVRKQGAIIIFPSFLLHRVKPVLTGIRRSLILWIHGQPYR